METGVEPLTPSPTPPSSPPIFPPLVSEPQQDVLRCFVPVSTCYTMFAASAIDSGSIFQAAERDKRARGGSEKRDWYVRFPLTTYALRAVPSPPILTRSRVVAML
jgi:hypothetical protein